MTDSTPQKKLTVCDVIIIASVVILSVISLLFSLIPHGTYKAAVIKTDKDTITVRLDNNEEFDIESNGHTYTVKIEDNEISIIRADCPDGICKNTRAIGKRSGTAQPPFASRCALASSARLLK